MSDETSREKLLQKLESLTGRALEADALARTVHDLEVHQIELELQNRALRLAQHSLDKSRERYVSLYDFAPISLCSFDSAGCLVEINLTGATMLGGDRAAMLGLPFLALVHMDEPRLFWTHLRATIESAARTVTTLGFTTRSGRHVDVEAVTVPWSDASNEKVRFRTALVDLFERKRADASERLLVEAARDALQAEQRRRAKLEALDRTNLQITEALLTLSKATLTRFFQVIVDEVRGLADAEYAALGVFAGPGRPLSPWVYSGMSAEAASLLGKPPRPVGVLGAVINEGKNIRVKDLRKHPAFAGFPEHHPLMTSFLAVPVRYGQQIMGNFYLANKRGGGEFSEDDERIVTMLARRVGSSMEMARLHERETQQRDGLLLLAEATSALAGALTPEDVSQAAATIARSIVPVKADHCTVLLLDEGGGFRELGAEPSAGASMGALASAYRAALEQPASPVSCAVHTRRSVLVADVEGEAVPEHTRAWMRQTDATSRVLLPLVGREGVLGVLVLSYAASGRQYDERDVQIGEAIAMRVALSMDNARLYQLAQDASRAREQLLAVVSHDLRSPLSAIVLSTHLLLSTTPASEDSGARKRLEIIGRAAMRMERLIKDLLTFATINAGAFVLDPQPTDLAALIEEAIAGLGPLAAPSGIRIEASVSPGLPSVLCDRERVLQVFSNLIGNALKFSRKGGTITVVAEEHGEEVRVAVSDTGRGIPKEALPRVFDRYWKSESGGQGVGLGLSIVKAIVEAHRGHVEVASVEGEGSTFWFTLPRCEGGAS
jgi:PAS domain S-box-containing protein